MEEKKVNFGDLAILLGSAGVTLVAWEMYLDLLNKLSRRIFKNKKK